MVVLVMDALVMDAARLAQRGVDASPAHCSVLAVRSPCKCATGFNIIMESKLIITDVGNASAPK
jgi:hypothetical protein